MELIIENWRKYLNEEPLNEKMMLKPGPNGWDLYARLVGEAYLAAPKFEQRAVPHFEALTPFINKMFDQFINYETKYLTFGVYVLF